MTMQQALAALHHGQRPFVLPNAWDVASALLLQSRLRRGCHDQPRRECGRRPARALAGRAATLPLTSAARWPGGCGCRSPSTLRAGMPTIRGHRRAGGRAGRGGIASINLEDGCRAAHSSRPASTSR